MHLFFSEIYCILHLSLLQFGPEVNILQMMNCNNFPEPFIQRVNIVVSMLAC